LAVVVGCGGSHATGGGNDGSTDHSLAKDSGMVTCGGAICSSSEVCLVPPCACVTLGDAASCPAPYCVAPTPETPLNCTPLDGGLSGTVTSADGGSRVCYHICI
jgi:hypothetical protein